MGGGAGNSTDAARQPSAVREVSLNNWSLMFSDPQLEHEFRVHQRRVWQSTELWRLQMNLLAGLINLSITTYLLSLGNVFTKQGANIVAPYMTVAVVHYCICRWQRGCCRFSLVNHLGEACYSLICTLSMPTWVLHGECMELKVFLRKLILGSGILIGYWCRFLTPTFFAVACVLTPLQFAFQALYLTSPTCDALLASPYSTGALTQLLHSLGHLASWSILQDGPQHTSDPSTATSTPSTSSNALVMAASADQTQTSCHSLMYVLQLFAGGTLLYLQYRMERGNRLAFLQGRVKVAAAWARVPLLVQAVLHGVVFLQVFAVVWVVFHGVSGGGGVLSPPAASAAGA